MELLVLTEPRARWYAAFAVQPGGGNPRGRPADRGQVAASDGFDLERHQVAAPFIQPYKDAPVVAVRCGGDIERSRFPVRISP